MGMFDEIRSTHPAVPETQWIQTKDFDSTMSKLELRDDGIVYVELYDLEEVPENERPYPRPFHTVGSLRRKSLRWVPAYRAGYEATYHGIVHIGQYVCFFENGRLSRVLSPVEFEKVLGKDLSNS